MHTTPNGIVPGVLNPVARPTVTISGRVSSTERTQLRNRNGRAPGLDSSPSSFTLVLKDPIDRVTDMSVSNFNSRGVIWGITPKRGTDTLFISPAPQEPLGFGAQGSSAGPAHISGCGAAAPCEGTEKSSCEPCDCDWQQSSAETETYTCEQPVWWQLRAPPMAYPTQTALLQWLQRYTPIGWQWIISPDGYTGVRPYIWSIPKQNSTTTASGDGSTTTTNDCSDPHSTLTWCGPPTLRLCFGSDRPLNPSFGWILGFRERCYTFQAPILIPTVNLLIDTSLADITWSVTNAGTVFPQVGASLLAHVAGNPGPGVMSFTSSSGGVPVGYLVAVEPTPSGSRWAWFTTRPTARQISSARSAIVANSYGGITAELPNNGYTLTFTDTGGAVVTSDSQAIPADTHVVDCPSSCVDPCGPNLYRASEGAQPVMTAPSYQAAANYVEPQLTPIDIVDLIKPSRVVEVSTQVVSAQGCTRLKADLPIAEAPGTTAIGLVTQRPPGLSSKGNQHQTTSGSPPSSPTPVPEPIPGTGTTPVTPTVSHCKMTPLPHRHPCAPYYAEAKYDLWGTETFALCIDDFQTRGSGGTLRTTLSGQDSAPNAIGFLEPQSPPSSPTAGNMGGELQLNSSATRSYTGPVKIARLGISVSDSRGIPVDLVDDFSLDVSFTSAYDPA